MGATELHGPSHLTGLTMHLHICPLDSECRKYGAPWRACLDHAGWNVILALRPSSTSQAWTPWGGSSTKWRWLTIHPPRDKMCGTAVSDDRPFCSRLRGHRGAHSIPPFLRDPEGTLAELKATKPTGRVITDEINRDPQEVTRLRRSRQQARTGQTMPWLDSDED